MNKNQATKWVGRQVRLRPRAIHITDGGQRLPPHDDHWLVVSVSDTYVELSSEVRGLRCELGLDNVHSYQTPNFLNLRCQLTVRGVDIDFEPIVRMSSDRSISGFATLLNQSWVQEFIDDQEVWLSEVDSLFQIHVYYSEETFQEEWTNRFPDKENSFRVSVRLKIQGVSIKELTFVSCDGGRILLPLPKVNPVDTTPRFLLYRDSLEYRVGQIIGQFYIYGSLDNAASRAGIGVHDRVESMRQDANSLTSHDDVL